MSEASLRCVGGLPLEEGAVVIDPQMVRIFQLIERIGPSGVSLLLLGETGAGKEVLADWAHRCSRSQEQPLVRINCAGLSESLIESELFGHERGAFTGAVQAHRGLFEVADRGTLFLDELAELPLRTQAKLLRVLETGEYCRLGSNQVRRARVRLIAATHVDLPKLIERGGFRRDLYFRLNGATIEVPPLRARPSEVLPLAERFLTRAAAALARGKPGLTTQSEQALLDYPWPGNVRELRNVIECAAALCHAPWIVPEDLLLGRSLHSAQPDVQAQAAEPRVAEPAAPEVTAARLQPPAGAAGMRSEQLAFERQQIHAALERTGGNQTRAAALLGISRRTLTNKLNQHAIDRPRKRAQPLAAPADLDADEEPARVRACVLQRAS